jgi:anti-sigma regulatory factor (Ser/Thr protein kinase)
MVKIPKLPGEPHQSVPEVIRRLFAARTYITSGDVAIAAGVTRQGALYHLSRMTEQGLLIRDGLKRGARYRLSALRWHDYLLKGLSENEVWGNERIFLRDLAPEVLETPNVLKIVQYAFTEIVNNAIDHSGGSSVAIRWFLDDERVSFEVEDDGVGAFARIREEYGLADDFEAIAELSKGKQTTFPDRHSGLGIFFTSRMVSRFVLSAGQVIWTVDNQIPDVAMGWLDRTRVGTLVRCEIRLDTKVSPLDIYAERSDPETGRFNKTTISLSLFNSDGFVSRSEAKRVGAHLEGFEVIELDFAGVREVGQAFADELFRVWAAENPGSVLLPLNANPAVTAMISAVIG